MASIKLEEIVSTFLLTNNLGKAEYSKIYQIGISGIRNLNLDVTGQAKTYDIHLDRNLTGNLPSDFINETKVHVHGDDCAGLLKDNNLCNEEDEDDDCYFSGDFGDLDFGERSTYGTAGIDWIGKYKIDRERHKIYVNPDFCYSCITLVYLASPQASASGEWFVDELAREAVEAYIRWKYNLDRRSTGAYERRGYEQAFLKEKRKARIRILNMTRGQLEQSARSGVKLKIKS